MPDSHHQPIVRVFRAGDERAIARIKLDAIAEGTLPGEDAAAVPRWAESLAVEPAGTVVAEVEGEVVGFLSPLEHQVVVDPAHRRRGIATRLIAFAEPASSPLLLWLPDDNPAAAAFFDASGYVYFASLWEMTLPAGALTTEPEFPDDVMSTPWIDVDLDEMVTVFNTAFLEHPTPVSVTREFVEWSLAQPGNERFGYQFLYDRATGKMIGIVRGRLNHGQEAAVGEVDFIGVLPEWRGRGLGRALLHWAVADLRRRGAGPVSLHVEAQNQQALGLYESSGFRQTHEWRRFARAIGRS
ncbi:MAG: GNAT family N-acetyltransferase, partial [Thermomicrobiales bacterium]|nr:GNAT family N-acetyltransferase [Thermomicrobiales bacterium]